MIRPLGCKRRNVKTFLHKFQNHRLENYCLSHKCLCTDDDCDVERWILYLHICRCPTKIFNEKISAAMNRVDQSIRCCGNSVITKDEINCKEFLNPSNSTCSDGDYNWKWKSKSYLIRVANDISFTSSEETIEKNNFQNIRQKVGGKLEALDENIFDCDGMCIGPAEISKGESKKEKYKLEQTQLRLLDCRPPCYGKKPCVR